MFSSQKAAQSRLCENMEKPLNDRWQLDVIEILSSEGESGRLQMESAQVGHYFRFR